MYILVLGKKFENEKNKPKFCTFLIFLTKPKFLKIQDSHFVAPPTLYRLIKETCKSVENSSFGETLKFARLAVKFGRT